MTSDMQSQINEVMSKNVQFKYLVLWQTFAIYLSKLNINFQNMSEVNSVSIFPSTALDGEQNCQNQATIPRSYHVH